MPETEQERCFLRRAFARLYREAIVNGQETIWRLRRLHRKLEALGASERLIGVACASGHRSRKIARRINAPDAIGGSPN